MRTERRSDAGFTIIELMLVAGILGLLAAIALPKFGDAIDRAKEAAIRGELGMYRSALTLYYADTEGILFTSIGPSDEWWRILYPKYLSRPAKVLHAIPRVKHSLNITWLSENTFLWIPGNPIPPPFSNFDLGQITYRWAYQPPVLSNVKYADIIIECTHKDMRGVVWSTQ